MANVTREEAVALFGALGIKTAEKWNAKRLASKINKVDEMVDENAVIEDDAIVATLTACLTAIEAGEAITITGAAAETPEPAAKAAKPPKADDEAKAAAKAAAAEAKEKKKADAEAAKAERAKKAAEAKAAKAANSTPGVRETPTRAGAAGQVIAKHGLAAGITKEMVAEVNAIYGKANDSESMFRLKDAWHAISDYLAATK